MRVLMCPPTEYKIGRKINHWMNPNNQPDKKRAWEQWHKVFEIYQKLGIKVYLIKPVPGLADMVFCANAAWGRKGNFVLSNFKWPERQAEQEHYKKWLRIYGFKTLNPFPENVTFEGQGDLITLKEAYLFGYGVRSSLTAKSFIEKKLKLKKEIIPLRLVDPKFPQDPRFYHLDTCLMYVAPIDTIIYYPGAFDKESQEKISRLKTHKIEVYEEEAENFTCNGVCFKNTVVLGGASRRIINLLKRKGLEVISIEMSEFKKSGGGLRCLTLFLD